MKNIIIVALISFYGLNLYSQDEPKVVVFNSSKSERKSSDVVNLVKFGMLEPFSGTFSVYFERVLTDKLSAEVGLGLTIDDYLNVAINDLDNLFDSGPREPKIGQAFALGLRYYPGLIPEDFYVAPEFRFKRYVNTFTYDDAGLSVVKNEARSLAIGRITFGYQYLVMDNIFWDFYGGFGIAQENGNSYEQVYNEITEVFEYQNFEQSGLTPRLHIGIKLGIGF
ncbi:MAG: hypothetical protein GQ574_02280 [Crocinitomix sp.]|nr:hypothetical protein [Crocinitomix sp.]